MRENGNGQPAERLAYSVSEVAAITGLSRDLLYDQMRIGRLAYLKVGRRRIITRQHLEAFLTQETPLLGSVNYQVALMINDRFNELTGERVIADNRPVLAGSDPGYDSRTRRVSQYCGVLRSAGQADSSRVKGPDPQDLDPGGAL